jgi:homogentisate 1,2-dioxygenase
MASSSSAAGDNAPVSTKGYAYMAGFGNHCTSEALPGALAVGQNSPQVCPYGLYAEQLTGSSFTAPRHKNVRSWLYRIRPSVGHTYYTPYIHPTIVEGISSFVVDPNQFRWDPVPVLPNYVEGESASGVDFVDGLIQMAGAGCESLKDGLAVYHYRCNISMDTPNSKRVFSDADGCMLIVPDTGVLDIRTEFGQIEVAPKEICVIPRGIKFSVNVSESSRGYICEIFKGMYELPSLGAIGANGLANPRDFEVPVAAFQDMDVPHKIINKFQGHFFQCVLDHSPFDVVAWHGNYHPYKYDLTKFNTMNSVSFDHPVSAVAQLEP